MVMKMNQPNEIDALKQAWYKFLNDIAEEWHLYAILDWMTIQLAKLGCDI